MKIVLCFFQNDSENLTDSQKSPKKRTHPSEVKSSPKKIKKERKEAVVDEDDEEKEPINANEAGMLQTLDFYHLVPKWFYFTS